MSEHDFVFDDKAAGRHGSGKRWST
jgi:hypothetical protein